MTDRNLPRKVASRSPIQESIATLTLDRAAKLNALGPEMLADLERHIAAIDRDYDVRVVILTGTGERAFCVGADVNAWAALEPLDMWRRWIREGHRVLQRLANLRQPTIAAVNGFAFGGGLELALAADIRIAAEAASFAMPETKIGTLPGWAGTTRLPEAIGAARAKQMIFSGTRIDAVHGRALGDSERGCAGRRADEPGSGSWRWRSRPTRRFRCNWPRPRSTATRRPWRGSLARWPRARRMAGKGSRLFGRSGRRGFAGGDSGASHGVPF